MSGPERNRRSVGGRPRFGRRAAQHGLSLLAVAALAALLGLMAVVAYQRWSVTQLAQDRHDQDLLLDQAEAVVRGFVASRGRLPCPSPTYGGSEQCGGSLSTGWFPAASVSAPAAVRGRLAGLRYFADARLSRLVDVFPPDPHDASRINGHDLCRQLALLYPPAGGPDGGLPGTGPTGSPAVYRLSAPGPAGFSGGNLAANGAFEDEYRAQDAVYRERVRVGDARTLAWALNCGAIIGSLNMLRTAGQWNDAMPNARSGAAHDYDLFTVWPMANALVTSQTVALAESATFITETFAVAAGISAAEFKDDMVCAGFWFPACIASGVQVAQLIMVGIQGAALALDVLALEARVIAAAIELAKVKNFHSSYETVPLWQDSQGADVTNRVLFKVDELGPGSGAVALP
ncbi:hypothetical protein [Pseudacidovorax sp. RU35E]|uniref:hypothetical protein n=1 Tax=Pseudacidovorax sp. RU35E TaxID=1907403 RepID=UPI000954226A|nr:hypothetical protein [Pseudacidovorax sp. RU35E]SIR73076.1 hypothetical protein SAMN05880557_11825 [Pseudacidovorax sp. RU35E]